MIKTKLHTNLNSHTFRIQFLLSFTHIMVIVSLQNILNGGNTQLPISRIAEKYWENVSQPDAEDGCVISSVTFPLLDGVPPNDANGAYVVNANGVCTDGI